MFPKLDLNFLIYIECETYSKAPLVTARAWQAADPSKLEKEKKKRNILIYTSNGRSEKEKNRLKKCGGEEMPASSARDDRRR